MAVPALVSAESNAQRSARLQSRFAWAFVISVLAAVSIDALLFRTNIYRALIDPESAAGQIDLVTRMCSIPAAKNNVLVLGDSRIAQGFSARRANAMQNQLRLFSAAVPGATPRVWYYLLRQIDPGRRRFGIIVLSVEDYNDEDSPDDLADRTLDTRMLIFDLRLSDVLTYAASFRSARQRFETVRALLFKGFLVRDDVRAFAANPVGRLNKVRLFSQSGVEWANNYDGNPGTVGADQLQSLRARPIAPQTGRLGEYRKMWFQRIIERYRCAGVRIVFARVPATPLATPHVAVHSRVIPTLRYRHVTILDENTFSALEQPRYFVDTAHLNTEGRMRFSAMLAHTISNALLLP